MRSLPIVFIFGFTLLLASCSGVSDETGSSGEKPSEAGASEAVMEEIPYPEVRIKPFPLALSSPETSGATLFDLMDAAVELEIPAVETFHRQPLSRDMPGEVFSSDMSPGAREKIKERLKKLGLSLSGYSGISLLISQADLEKEFKFARDLGIGLLIIDADSTGLPLLEEMVKRFNLRVALAGQVDSSRTSSPAEMLGWIQNLDRRIGISADIGSWIGAGINPPDALKSLANRALRVGLVDLSEIGNPAAHEVPLGEGSSEIRSVLAQLTLQNYGGAIVLDMPGSEGMEDRISAVRGNKEFIARVTHYLSYSQILGSRRGRFFKHGWNHYGPGYFLLNEETGVIKSQGGMGLFWYSVRKYRDFVLELEYKCASEDTNSGIFLRVPEMPTSDDYIYHSFEIQIDDAGKGIHRTGSAYDAQAPSADAFKPTGEWNHYKITFQGSRIQVELNGTQVLDWEAEPRGKIRDFSSEGYIGLQNHDSRSPVFFRNIYIKEL